MLYSLRFRLQADKKLEKGDCLGPALHGALMEMIPESFVEQLHVSSVHPFSQYVETDSRSGEITWTIAALNQVAKEQILDRVQMVPEIRLKYKDVRLTVQERTIKYIPGDVFLKDYLMTDRERIIHVSFLSPTSFKQNDEYVLFPTTRLILQSLMNRYDASADDDTSMADPDVLASLENQIKIVGYRLRSAKYPVGGVRIPSFVGDVTLRVFGPQQMVNLVWMLVKYGEFSGVGIKTALGMGAIIVTGGDNRVGNDEDSTDSVARRNRKDRCSSSKASEESVQ